MGLKNLTFDDFTTERVIHWRLLLETYGPTIKYIKGTDNDSSDSLRRLPIINSDFTEVNIKREI